MMVEMMHHQLFLRLIMAVAVAEVLAALAIMVPVMVAPVVRV
jgi:NADH:ubiquinone oxidoreductase subunit K